MNFMQLISYDHLVCFVVDVWYRQRLCHYWLSTWRFVLLIVLLLGGYQKTVAVQLPQGSDRRIPDHSVGITGSDTLSPLLHAWGRALQAKAPGISLRIQASGSATAPVALASGHAVIGPMSRLISDIERKTIQQKMGLIPLEWPLALDALAFYVHPINPIKGLSQQEIERLFAKVPLCCSLPAISSWGELPALSHWLSREPIQKRIKSIQRNSIQRNPIQNNHYHNNHLQNSYEIEISGEPHWLHQLAQSTPRLIGRNSLSGTFHSVRKHLLCGGMFNSSMSELPSAMAIIYAISQQPTAIGFASFRTQLNTVKVLSIDGIYPSIESIRHKRYPWIRTLYLYVMAKPNQPMSPSLWTSLSWIYAEIGQSVLTELGFIPLSENQLMPIRRQLMDRKPQNVPDQFFLADTLLRKGLGKGEM